MCCKHMLDMYCALPISAGRVCEHSVLVPAAVSGTAHNHHLRSGLAAKVSAQQPKPWHVMQYMPSSLPWCMAASLHPVGQLCSAGHIFSIEFCQHSPRCLASSTACNLCCTVHMLKPHPDAADRPARHCSSSSSVLTRPAGLITKPASQATIFISEPAMSPADLPCRAGRGGTYRQSRLPKKPIDVWGYEVGSRLAARLYWNNGPTQSCSSLWLPHIRTVCLQLHLARSWAVLGRVLPSAKQLLCMIIKLSRSLAA